MIEYIKKYKRNGTFEFQITTELSKVCNAPKDVGGVYLVYQESEDIDNLIYIGRSGK